MELWIRSQDTIIKDLVILEAIKILKGEVKVEYNKEDDKLLKKYYKFGGNNGK